MIENKNTVLVEFLANEASLIGPSPATASPPEHTNEVVTALVRAALTGLLRHEEFEEAPGRTPGEITSSAKLLAAAIARLENATCSKMSS